MSLFPFPLSPNSSQGRTRIKDVAIFCILRTDCVAVLSKLKNSAVRGERISWML